MNADARPGMSLAGRLLLLMALVVGVAAATVLGLGLWAIQLLGTAGASSSTVQTTTVLGVTLGATALVVFVCAGGWLWMRSLIRARMLGLAEVFGQATAGDRSLRAVVVGDDEFATLATAFNSLIDSGGSGSGSGGGTGEIQDAAALQSQIEKLLQEVSAVGDGDLRVQAEVTPDTLGVLADSFNYMIEELAKVVGRVQATTLQVTNATRRLLDRSAEVAQASEAQSAQISQTSEAVAQLANFVSLSARNALTASDTAQEALRNAQLGQTAVVQTIDGMVHIRENVQETSKRIKRLGERSQEVGEIVRLIEDIADQTNLLALNAAIQSAMAGEHGRGFAVVADEIRLLAERSTEATKRIATIVKSIQGDTYEAVVAMEESTQEVVNGSRLADEAGQALQSIFVAVERQAQTIEGIAHAAAERAPTSEAVATAMNRISEITRQTNAATQDAASSVSYLAELAEQLRASVAAFRLPERAAEAPALPMPPDNGFAQGLNLPNLGSQGWNGQADYPLPALPAAGGMSNFGGMPDYNGGAAPNFGAMPAYGNGSMPDYHGGAVPDFGAMPDYNAGGGAMPGYAGGAMPDYNNGAMPDYNNGAMPDYNNGAMPNFAPGYYPPLNGDQARPEYPGQPFPAGRPRTSGESY